MTNEEITAALRKSLNQPDEGIEFAISILSEMKRSLESYRVNPVTVRHAIIGASANLCGNHHDYVCWRVLGIPMVDDGEARI